MSLPIERWAREAVNLEGIGHSEGWDSLLGTPSHSWPGVDERTPFPDKFKPIASKKIFEDVGELAVLHRATWKERMRRIKESGVPMMGEGTFGLLMAYPPAATLATTTISGTVNLWPGAVYTPIPQNGTLTPQAYRVVICAKITTSTSPGNIGLDPRIGQSTWTTGGTAISGTTLGATGNVALTASITNAFYYIYGDLTIRTMGAPGGSNCTAVGMFHYVSTQATSGGLAGPAAVGTGHNLLFGGTAASYDGAGAAQGFQIGGVHTVTTITHNVEQIHGMDWN